MSFLGFTSLNPFSEDKPSAPPNPSAGAAGLPPPPGGTISASASAVPAVSSAISASNRAVSASSQATAAPVGATNIGTVIARQSANQAATPQPQSLNPIPIPPPPPAQQNLNDAAGRRVRLRPKPNAMRQILGSAGSGGGLLSPLYLTNGMLFPYQPVITYSQDVIYNAMEIVHANQDFYSYSKTPALKLTVEGEFTVQNQSEGIYALACIHFLRTVTKMDFGNGQNPGQPPPVLLFDAYGQWMFNALPVIVTQFSVTLPKDIDYVAVGTSSSANNTLVTAQPTPATAGAVASTFDAINNPTLAANNSNAPGGTTNAQGYAWLPSVFSITVQLTVQNTPQRLRAFNLNEFRTGQLLTQGTWV